MERAAAVGIACHTTEDLARRNALALAHGYGREVTIYGDVRTVAHHDVRITAEREYCGHFTVEDTAGLSTALAREVDSLVVEGYVAQTIDVVSPEAARDHVRSRDGNGEATAVGSEVVAQDAVCIVSRTEVGRSRSSRT